MAQNAPGIPCRRRVTRQTGKSFRFIISVVIRMAETNALGGRLRALRRRQKLTQECVSCQLHVSRETIRDWELGRREPPCEALAQLCVLYQTSADYILGITAAVAIHLDTLTDEEKQIICELVRVMKQRAGPGNTGQTDTSRIS